MASPNKKRKANMKPGDVVVTPTTSYVVNKNGKLVRMPTESERKNVASGQPPGNTGLPTSTRQQITQQILDKRANSKRPKAKTKVAPKRKKK
jgi:hypothetical protein